MEQYKTSAALLAGFISGAAVTAACFLHEYRLAKNAEAIVDNQFFGYGRTPNDEETEHELERYRKALKLRKKLNRRNYPQRIPHMGTPLDFEYYKTLFMD